jgi:hypothetical protein
MVDLSVVGKAGERLLSSAEEWIIEKKGNMKALGIMGSPRRQSNTEILLDKALEGAREAGAGFKNKNLTMPGNICLSQGWRLCH